MIKAHELRIGNYLKHVGDTWTIQIRDTIQPITAQDIFDIEWGADGYEAVVVTPEILEKAGFEYRLTAQRGAERDMRTWNINLSDVGELSSLEFWDGETIIERLRGWKICTPFHDISYELYKQPEHLHQLQNLYFALTGEELNIQS